jgi:hypothetical protein
MKPSIVFSHGIWADGSCFQKLIPTLRSEGHQVIAAQCGLDTLKGDIDATVRSIGRVSGPVSAGEAGVLPGGLCRRRTQDSGPFHGDLAGADLGRSIRSQGDCNRVVEEIQLRGGCPPGSHDQPGPGAFHDESSQVRDDRAPGQPRDLPLASEGSRSTDRESGKGGRLTKPRRPYRPGRSPAQAMSQCWRIRTRQQI